MDFALKHVAHTGLGIASQDYMTGGVGEVHRGSSGCIFMELEHNSGIVIVLRGETERGVLHRMVITRADTGEEIASQEVSADFDASATMLLIGELSAWNPTM